MVAFFVLIVWLVFFHTETPVTNENINASDPGQLPNVNDGTPANQNDNTNAFTGALPGIDTIAGGGATLVQHAVDSSVGAVKIVGDAITYYDAVEGVFYRIGEDGNPVLLSDQVFPQASNIAFSPVQNEAIMTFPDGTNIMYNFDTEIQVTLPTEMGEIRYSGDGAQIGFEFYQGHADDNFLGVSSPDGTDLKPVEALGDRGHDFDINWSPSKQVVATFRDSEDATRQNVYFVGQNQENFKSFTANGRGFDGVWTPEGGQIVYSVYSPDTDYQPMLHIVDASGDQVGANNESLGLRTFVDKCAFGGTSNMYCAVPSNMPEGAGLNRGLIAGSVDSFYKIDLQTGRISFLAVPVNEFGNQSYIAEQLFVNDDESKMYFTNQLTGSLDYIELK